MRNGDQDAAHVVPAAQGLQKVSNGFGAISTGIITLSNCWSAKKRLKFSGDLTWVIGGR